MALLILCLIMAAAFYLITVLYALCWTRHLTAHVEFGQGKVSEGEMITIREQIENRKLLPLLTLTVKYQLDRSLEFVEQGSAKRTDRQYRNDGICVMPYQRVTRILHVKAAKRGYYTVDKIDLVVTDPLYNRTHLQEQENETSLLVYPSRSRLGTVDAVFQRMYGECISRRFLMEDPFAFKGIRAYAPTDPMHRINWKSSARTGELMVNQYYDTTSQQVCIFLDVQQDEVFLDDALMEEGIRITRNLLEDFIGQGIPVSIVSNGVDVLSGQEVRTGEGAGIPHIEKSLIRLARIRTSGVIRKMSELLMEEKESMQRKNNLTTILISTNATDELAEAYAQYAADDRQENWLLPVHASMMRYMEEEGKIEQISRICTDKVRIEYLVMERGI